MEGDQAEIERCVEGQCGTDAQTASQHVETNAAGERAGAIARPRRRSTRRVVPEKRRAKLLSKKVMVASEVSSTRMMVPSATTRLSPLPRGDGSRAHRRLEDYRTHQAIRPTLFARFRHGEQYHRMPSGTATMVKQKMAKAKRVTPQATRSGFLRI